MLLCAGEALIDMLPRKTEAGEAGFAPYPGGSVFNTAVAAARLGMRTGFFSGLSTDLFGERLAAVLATAGVDTRLAARSDRPTTLAFVTLTNGQARYAFYDENTAGRMLTEADLPALPAEVQAVFLGGISLAVEPCAEAYAALAARATADRLVMLDPNIRPGFIADEARFRARMDRMLAAADVVKISDEDLAWLMGEGPLPELAAALLARGPALVLVTEGAEGVTAFGAGAPLKVPARKVTVVDTVGAGDTFNAGFLAGLSDAGAMDKASVRAGLARDVLEAALTLGVRAAAVTVSRAGANPPRREELA
ncbi:carbohydrate kinase family protein [Roseicyclus persicicus]|uniref:Carbohydrate kinase n=1 Tax=Roseicyclus persicicus TaxID=2650661 RepID=A0A7X6GX15_9RHOB|nr:carbohydrate kinase [Roseibacterium persicicum]NKX43944.1 carbohydrate kinase [Roseibacterium persicicum]